LPESYIGNRKELQDNSSVPIGPLTEQSEPIGDNETRISSVVPEKDRSADLGTLGRQTVSAWSVGGKPNKMGENSCAWVVGMRCGARGKK
jgi:hypothetical protein